MTAARPTVIVIDDDQSVREALGSLLRSIGLEARLYGAVSEFLSAAPVDGPSCLVLDVRLPGRSGLDLQSDLTRANNRLPVIFITGHGDIPMSVRAMKAGAVEFLTKPFREQDLLDAIRVALERDQARREGAIALQTLQRRLAELTPREREVMALVAAGRLNKQIAGDLGLSEVTVKVHRGQVMRKMAARSLADLVRMSDQLGLAPAASSRPNTFV